MLSFFNCCNDSYEINNDEDYFENVLEINTDIKYDDLIKIIKKIYVMEQNLNFIQYLQKYLIVMKQILI